MHPTAIERHVDDLLFHRRQPPFVVVLQQENGAWTVRIVTVISLSPIGLLSILHDIDTVTLGTLHGDKNHRTSPQSSSVCARIISECQLS